MTESTPINQPGPFLVGGTTLDTTLDERRCLTQAKAAGKVQAPKRRKSQPSTVIPSSKTRRAGVSRKTKGSNLASAIQCHDVSKGLSRTKPVAPRSDAGRNKAVLPPDMILPEQRPDADLMHDASTATATQNAEDHQLSHNPSYASWERYHFAGPRFDLGKAGNDIDIPAAQMLAKEELSSIKENVACNDIFVHGAKTSFDNEAVNRCKPCDEAGEAIPAEFLPPPSAQGENEVQSTEVSPPVFLFDQNILANAPSKFRTDSDYICSDGENDDQFPLEERDLEAMMQSGVPSAAPEEFAYEGFPSILSDYGVDDEIWRSNLPCFSNSILGSDIITQNEQLTLPIENRMRSRTSSHHDPTNDYILNDISGNAGQLNGAYAKPSGISEDCFDDNDLDEELMDMPAPDSDVVQPSTPLTSPAEPTTPKLQWLPPKVYIPAKFSAIWTTPTDIPHLVSFDTNSVALPFMRPPFPRPIRDRSPIFGLTNRTVLRTCFRIGEALNAAAVASRTNTDAVIELYARVTHSERETGSGFKQYFQFGDLFTDKPPYLSATYGLWKSEGLRDIDSKVFLGVEGRGKMARALGRIKRREQGGCEMIVLSIWEVDWEDVGVAKGIVCS